ncbi:MAG: hypothetical protein QOK33_2386 [Mycobacterium sp.]|jgi:hypothetical protein|nr:hypothetical protein [Mycobacterium sp.]
MSATGGIGGIGHKFSRRRVLVTLHIRFLHSQRSRGGLCESLWRVPDIELDSFSGNTPATPRGWRVTAAGGPPMVLRMDNGPDVDVWSQDVFNSSVAGHALQSRDILYVGGYGRGA